MAQLAEQLIFMLN